jgi:hypothetical protein
MNYTGFGTDPNLIYSFRGGMATGPAMGSGQYADRFSGLRNSPAYKQADARGRQRMEQAVEMGLPAQTDISRARRTGTVTMDRRPEYFATRPQSWGTWGALGSTQKAGGYSEETVKEKEQEILNRAARDPRRRMGFGVSEMASPEEKRASQILDERAKQNAPTPEPAPEGYIRNRYGYLEPEEWYTSDSKTGTTRKKTLQEYRKSSKEKPFPKMPEQDQSWRMSLLGGGPTLGFPQQTFSYL